MLQITLSLSLFRCCYCTQVHSISKSGSGKESRLNEHHGLGQQASPALSRRKEPHASSKPEYDQSKSVFILLERKEKKSEASNNASGFSKKASKNVRRSGRKQSMVLLRFFLVWFGFCFGGKGRIVSFSDSLFLTCRT